MDNIYAFSTQESSQTMLLAEGFNSDAGLGISDDLVTITSRTNLF